MLISSSKEKNLIDASRSICTTDTFVKTAVQNVKLDNKNIKVYGFAKGSGMISPNTVSYTHLTLPTKRIV